MITDKRSNKGYSFIETLITSLVFLTIMSGVYLMVRNYGDSAKIELSRTRLYQESRFVFSAFANEIKDAGAVLTVANTNMMGKTPHFNGIYPLNSYTKAEDAFPDGIILAAGDPNTVTRLRVGKPFDASSDSVISVKNVIVYDYDPTYPDEVRQWGRGDKGIVIGENGYFIFSVISVNQLNPEGWGDITIRSTPVYYSGQLDIINRYKDHSTTKGNTVVYPADDENSTSMVCRLSNFSIYLFREITHVNGNIRQLIRVVDTGGAINPLSDGSDSKYYIMSEKIWDMQISYVVWPRDEFVLVKPDDAIPITNIYFEGGETQTSFDLLEDNIQAKNLRQVNIGMIVLTNETGARYQSEGGQALNIPVIADEPATAISSAMYSYRVMKFSVFPRNYYHDFL